MTFTGQAIVQAHRNPVKPVSSETGTIGSIGICAARGESHAAIRGKAR
jgi:hypothetical protein